MEGRYGEAKESRVFFDDLIDFQTQVRNHKISKCHCLTPNNTRNVQHETLYMVAMVVHCRCVILGEQLFGIRSRQTIICESWRHIYV